MIQETFFPDLCRDHRQLGDLVMSIRCEHDALELKQLAAAIQEEVRQHFEIEDQELYPILLDAVEDWEDRERLLGAYECNLLILRLLDQLSKTPPSDDLYKGKVYLLDKLWEYHVQEEEEPLFDMARRYLDQQELRSLARRIRNRSRALKGATTGSSSAPADPRGSFFGSLEQDRKRVREHVTALATEHDRSMLNYLAYDLELIIRRHLEVEEEVVYPVLEEVVEDPEARSKLTAAREQLGAVMAALTEVAEMPVTDDGFYGKVRAVDRLWTQYLVKEEPVLYEMARHHLPEDEVASLEKRVATVQHEREETRLRER